MEKAIRIANWIWFITFFFKSPSKIMPDTLSMVYIYINRKIRTEWNTSLAAFFSLRLFEKSIKCDSSRMLHNVSQSIRFNILFQFKISEHHNFLSCQVSAWESVISHEIKNRTRPSPPRDLHTIPHWYTTANNLSSFYRACHYFWFWKISAKSYNKQNVPEKVTLNKVSSGILFS